MSNISCELCQTLGGVLLWEDDFLRIIRVESQEYVGFCRVILKRHGAEMTDLNLAERARLMNVVYAVETVLRAVYQPTKMNLASLGNVVPHLHWHIIPRFQDDPHFPNPIWGEVLRPAILRSALPDAELKQRIALQLASESPSL
ncbi:MAG: HIT family protein [Thiotrichaceae bacterium]|nr:HIT family protein [Thiotrichaceae bacterium]